MNVPLFQGHASWGRRMDLKPLCFGAIGLGRALRFMLPSFLRHPLVELVAVADIDPNLGEDLRKHHKVRVYSSIEEISDDPEVDVIYIATPHELHAAQACHAASRGKHVLVEKPMATTLKDCEVMIEAARRAGVVIVVGHTHSFDAPIRRAAELIAEGRYGALRAVQALNYTDWLARPRRSEELQRGGGVLLNQAPHQIDIVRRLVGRPAQSVRGHTALGDASRPVVGSYMATVSFEDDVVASLTYNGFGHFDSDEFCDWISELGRTKAPASFGIARKAVARGGGRLEPLGGSGPQNPPAPPISPVHHQHFGLVIASCEKADLRPTPNGVLVYSGDAIHLDPLPPPAVPRSEVIDEVFEAVINGKPALHNGEWALETMKLCLAIQRSQQERREVTL